MIWTRLLPAVLLGTLGLGASALAAPPGHHGFTVTGASGQLERPRTVVVSDHTFGGATVEHLTYDAAVILRPIALSELASEPDWSIAVRLLLSEVGADRLLKSRWGLIEAIGILETITNRLDADTANPDGIDGVAPWPGCEAGATWASCANPKQYLGLRKSTALAPARAKVRASLSDALDLAMTAWWLHSTGLVTDVTDGATGFVHRCGGAAYGERTIYCDRRRGGTPDIPGALPHSGPIVFKGPAGFDPKRGYYPMQIRRVVDFRTGPPLAAGEAARTLWGPDALDMSWSFDDDADDDPRLSDVLASDPELAELLCVPEAG